MIDLLQHLIDILKQSDLLVVDGILAKNKVIESALRLDPNLLRLLCSSELLKKTFFQEIDNILVFDKIKFQSFVSSKEFLADSFTEYKNKIGLASDTKQYISDSEEIVLVFPYKDCVLEGGQTKEDSERKEVFWSENLALEEIDRLLEPKVLTNFKRFGAGGALQVADISINDNLVIKGNNLITLHSLKKRYKGLIKLIYIDPPYNTDSDSFKYNDSFKHSTWLTFMKNRVEIARELLTEDGVIFTSLDDKEAHYCKVLFDEIFGRENFVADICHKARASVSNDKIISASHNHILLYAKNERLVFQKKALFGLKPDLTGFDGQDQFGEFKLVPVDGPGGEDKGNPFFEFLGIKNFWRFSASTMKKMHEEGLIVKKGNGLYQKYYKSKAEKSRKTITTWWDEGYLTSTATGQLKKLMGKEIFKNPKNVNLIKTIIDLWARDGDIVLDFFAGSGTTAQAVLELNNEDSCNRKFILCEQMDYVENVTIERVKKAIQNHKEANFVYFELKQLNQIFIEKIQNAKNQKELLEIWDTMKQSAFLSYKINPEDIDATKKDFGSLSFDTQQKLLISLLDKNLLYMPYSEIDDKSYSVSNEDKNLNHRFYSDQ